MMLYLACRNCTACLASAVRWGAATDIELDATGVSLLPKGVFVRTNRYFLDGYDIGDSAVRQLHSISDNLIAVHAADVTPEALHKSGIDQGCCGSDGMDGPNRACRCGAVVATERSDCWTPHYVEFDANQVSVEQQANTADC